MKIRLLIAIAELAIGFAVPVFAQQKDAVDRQAVQQRDLLGVAKALDDFGELSLKVDEAFNKNHAASLAALFTEDFVLVAPDRMFNGRQEIKNGYADMFRRSAFTDFNSRRERYHLNAIHNAAWSAGQWASTLLRQTGSVFVWDFWSAIYIREAGTWNIWMLALSEHPDVSLPSELLKTVQPRLLSFQELEPCIFLRLQKLIQRNWNASRIAEIPVRSPADSCFFAVS